jgi:dolichyl-phosphate beta-glucosyltransferase
MVNGTHFKLNQLLVSVLFLLYQFSPAAFTSSPRPSLPSERVYTSVTSNKPQQLPSIHDIVDDSIQLTVIVPAYNEAERLPLMLDEALDHLSTTYNSDKYEILVVDDGSKDRTSDKALEFAKQNANRGGRNIRVIKLTKNRGKGGAVRHGMLHSRGKRILFADADGASRFADLALLEKAMDEMTQEAQVANGSVKKGGKPTSKTGDVKAIALGSRAHMVKTEAVVKVSLLMSVHKA